MKKLVSLVLFLALVVAIVLYAAGAFRGDQVQPDVLAAPPGPTPPTATAQAVRAPVSVREDAVGTVTPRTEVAVSAQVQARVKKVHAEAGQRVEAGRPLVDLDDRELAARRAQARDALAQTRAARDRALAAKERGEALASQRERSFQRIEKLHAEQVASDEEREAAEAAYLTAKASVAEADAVIAVADAHIQHATQVLAEADVALEHATIKVPMDGVVSLKDVEDGDLAWPGKTLYEILDPTDLRLEAQVREGLLGHMDDGTEFDIYFPGLDKVVPGMVSEVCPVADPRSRTFRVRVEFDPVRGVHPGMFGRLRIPLQEREAVSVPVAAVRRTGQLESVLVQVEDGRWAWRLVTTGKVLADDRVEILSGLVGGETVGLEESER